MNDQTPEASNPRVGVAPRGMEHVSLGSVLLGIAALSIGGAVTAIASTLMPEHFLPANLQVLRPASGLIVFFAILLVWSLQHRVSPTRTVAVVIASGVALLLLLLLYHYFSVAVVVGQPEVNRTYLIGFALTPHGRDVQLRCGTDASLEELVGCAGPHLISEMWGSSFDLVAVVFILSYFVMLAGLAGAIAAAVIRADLMK
jgi:hypothetical protein